MPGLYGGGAEDVILKIAEGFSKRGVSIDLVVVKKEGELQSRVSEGVNLVDLEASRIATSVFPLCRYIRRESPKAIVSALTPTNIISVISNILAGRRLSTILTEHNIKSVSISRKDHKSRVFSIIARFVYYGADEIVAASSRIADDLCEIIQVRRRNVNVIHNPVFDQALQESAREELNHPWFQSNIEVVLGVGRLTSKKDFPTLIRSFARLREVREARLVILGEGEERQDLEALSRELGVSDDVDLPGFVDNPIKYMAQADVFVLSSTSEGFGNVVVEALASGVPVVSTCGDEGPGEILENGRYGKLVPSGNPEAMSEAISETLERPDQPASREERIQRARDFSVEKAIEKYWSIVNQYV